MRLSLRYAITLPIWVTDCLTGVERYKWDTTSTSTRGVSTTITPVNLGNENEQKERNFSEDELRRLAKYFDVLIEMDQKQRSLHKRANAEPGGLSMLGEGRTCSLCRNSVHHDGWFDKWGFKCPTCQNAVNKRKVPGSLCRDYNFKKYIPDTVLAFYLGVSVSQVRKMIRAGAIKARRAPNGPYMILRKDNPKH